MAGRDTHCQQSICIVNVGQKMTRMQKWKLATRIICLEVQHRALLAGHSISTFSLMVDLHILPILKVPTA